jgi:Core-2/I-Branching enzyme
VTQRVCYFIQSHRDPEQILRLVRTLRRGSSDGIILVSHDCNASALDWSPFAQLPNVHLIGQELPPAPRAGYGRMMGRLLHAIHWLEEKNLEYGWLVTLTAQDYPVRPVPQIEAFLAATPADGFIRWWGVNAPDSPWPRRKARLRYRYRYWRLPDRCEPAMRALRPLTSILPLNFYLAYGAWAGVPALHTPFTPQFPCLGGWTWFHLRRAAARYLTDFLDARPDVEGHYRRCIAPEESLMQTVLVNSGRFNLVNDDLRYIDYSNAVKGAPRDLTLDDLPLIRQGHYHFARKFDYARAQGVLDRIDRELL